MRPTVGPSAMRLLALRNEAFSMDTALGAGLPRYYDSFTEAAREVYDAHTWVGLHFRNSTMEGAWIGRKVARYVVANFFRPAASDQDRRVGLSP